MALTGARLLYPETVSQDARGLSVVGLDAQLRDLGFGVVREYRAFSKGLVVRGLHHQTGVSKLVRCSSGLITDYVVDLREKNFGSVFTVQLSGAPTSPYLYVPHWCAHGYASLEPSEVVYLMNGGYNAPEDKSILWSSINAQWPFSSPILSERDEAGMLLADFPPLRI
ncbi:MAG: dTDP-4-dehydrorhamnose 3,5-epimerase [Polyangiaceae bacterium]